MFSAKRLGKLSAAILSVGFGIAFIHAEVAPACCAESPREQRELDLTLTTLETRIDAKEIVESESEEAADCSITVGANSVFLNLRCKVGDRYIDVELEKN